MIRKSWSSLALIASMLLLCGCSTARLAGYPAGPVADAAVPLPEAMEAQPSGTVIAEPLPPLEGYPAEPGPVDVAALPPRAAPSGRSAVVGAWTARDASGASCRVQLSSSPALDLYRASASGCGNKDLARVTAWDYRDGEIYLYQPGGTVTARLRGGGGSLAGVMSKSGAPLSLSK